MRSFLTAAGVVLALAAASLSAAEDLNWLPAERPVALDRGSLLRGLLTWPDKEPAANDDRSDSDTPSNEGDEPEEAPLESDRPDFTEGTATVGRGRLQIEGGYTFTQAESGDPTADKHDLPELRLRYGIAERLELRLAWDEGMVFDRHIDGDTGRTISESGSSDLNFGFKYAITKQHGWRPQTSILAAATFPVGSPGFSSRQVDAEINYLYGWELTKRLSLNCSTGSEWTAESGNHYSQFHQSASLVYELTERLHVFNEWYAFFRRDFSDNRPQHNYDVGVTYLVTPNFQLDWRAGMGLNDAADGFLTGCGLTIRR